MTKQTDSARTPCNCLWLRLLLVQSMSWMGILSLFSSNLVLAQTSPPTAESLSGAKSERRFPPIGTLQEGGFLRSERSSRDVAIARSAHAEAIAPTVEKSNPPADSLNQSRVERLRQKLRKESNSVNRGQPIKEEVATPRAPELSPIKVRSVAEPKTKLSSPVQVKTTRILGKTASDAGTDGNGAFIDKNDYSLGATSGYEAPNSVVFTERSTGCKAVLRQGQRLSDSLCRNALGRKTRFAIRGIQSANAVRLPRPQTPAWVRRSRAISVAKIAPIRLGPISLSTSGISATDNSTLPPPGQLGSANKKMLFPLSIPAPITSIFGFRLHPITGDYRLHAGMDLGAPMGTPVLAAETGKVAIADFLDGYGLTVVLDHNKSTQQTLYGHLSDIYVQPGEQVEQGTVIGRVGSTGNSTGPHLHFETRYLTRSGWVVADPSAPLEYATARLLKALHPGHSTQQLKDSLAEQKTIMERATSTDNPDPTKNPSKTGNLKLKGKVGTDPGTQLEQALAHLVDALRTRGEG